MKETVKRQIISFAATCVYTSGSSAGCVNANQRYQFYPLSLQVSIIIVIPPPARWARRSFKFALFLFFFGVRSRRRAHGWCRWTLPFWAQHLKSISSRTSYQNTHFNMYTATSKQQEGSRCKDSHPKCFITTSIDLIPPRKSGESKRYVST